MWHIKLIAKFQNCLDISENSSQTIFNYSVIVCNLLNTIHSLNFSVTSIFIFFVLLRSKKRTKSTFIGSLSWFENIHNFDNFHNILILKMIPIFMKNVAYRFYWIWIGSSRQWCFIYNWNSLIENFQIDSKYNFKFHIFFSPNVVDTWVYYNICIRDKILK